MRWRRQIMWVWDTKLKWVPRIYQWISEDFYWSKTSFWSKYSNRILASWQGEMYPFILVTCKQPKTFKEDSFLPSNKMSSYSLTLDSSWATSSRTSLCACSSCWGLARSRSVVKFWSSQGARWWRASRGKWSPDTQSRYISLHQI